MLNNIGRNCRLHRWRGSKTCLQAFLSEAGIPQIFSLWVVQVSPNDHLSKHSECPKCSHNISFTENAISEYIKTLGINVLCHDRGIIPPPKGT